MKKFMFAAMAIFAVFALIGCGGGGEDPAPYVPPYVPPVVTPEYVDITFNANATSVDELDADVGNMPTSPLKIEEGTTLPAALFTDAGYPTLADYEFVAWYTDADYMDGDRIFDTDKFYEDAALFARWVEEGTEFFDVTFNYNYAGANPATHTEEFVEGDPLEYPAVRVGYRLEGWYTEAVCTTAAPATVTATGTYYAKWIQTFEITFVLSGGSYGDDTDDVVYTFDKDEQLTLPVTNPSKAGNTFKGWFTAATGGTQVTAGGTVTANATYYAQWEVSEADEALTIVPPVKTAYVQGDIFTISATTNTENAINWSIQPTSTTITVNPASGASTTVSIANNANTGPYTVRATLANVTPPVSKTWAFSVDYAMSGPAIEGGKDNIANAQFTAAPGAKVIWSLADWIAKEEEDNNGDWGEVVYDRDPDSVNDQGANTYVGLGNFQESQGPFMQAGNPVTNILNGGINVTDRRFNNYDMPDLRFSHVNLGTAQAMILTDFEYQITFTGVVLSETAVSDNPRFGGNGSPYTSSPETTVGTLGAAPYQVFKAVMVTTQDYAWTGTRLYLGPETVSASAPGPDIRITGIWIEELRAYPDCECTGCPLNGESISTAKAQNKKCDSAICEKVCKHNCAICKTIGVTFILPTDDLGTAYVVPTAPGANSFYLDLNESTEQYDVTNGGNAGGKDRPIIEKSANSVKYTFSITDQQLWIKLTTAQKDAIEAAGAGNAKIQMVATMFDPIAETASTVTTRAGFGGQVGSAWNYSNLVASPHTSGDVVIAAGDAANTTGAAYYIFQFRGAAPAVAELTIYAIRVVCEEEEYTVPADDGTAFFIDLNANEKQFFNPGGGSAHSRQAILTTSANEVSVLTTENSMLWFPLTQAQTDALAVANKKVVVTVDGTTPAAFAWVIGDQLTSSWNSAGWVTAPDSDPVSANVDNTRASKFFAIRLGGAGEATITSIKVDIQNQ